MANPSPGNLQRSILSALPAEIIVHIIGYVAADPPTLCSLACTCSLFQVECEKHIYKNIDLFVDDHVDILFSVVSRRPARLTYVEVLLMYGVQPERDIDPDLPFRRGFNSYISLMTSLKEWYIESPFDNFKWGTDSAREWVEKDMDQFQKALAAASWIKSDIANMQQSFGLQHGGLIRQHDIGLSKLEKRRSISALWPQSANLNESRYTHTAHQVTSGISAAFIAYSIILHYAMCMSLALFSRQICQSSSRLPG